MLNDMSDSSSSNGVSPHSFTSSPYSSPSQQVPHISNYMTLLSCNDKYMEVENGVMPFLVIVEQPNDHFRFRYKSEMVGTHGCLSGKSSSRTKTFPSVELRNYNANAVIRCKLVQYNNGKDHPHKLVEDELEKDLSAEVGPDKGYVVRFQGLGIIHTAKKDVPTLLYKKFSDKLTNFDARELRTHCENIAKTINLNIVRLKFSAHNIDTDEEICEPAYSEPIHNLKSAATNDLKICRMSRTSGKPRGGDDVYILTEKVNKNNIVVRFVEIDRGKVSWMGKGRFMQSDVHHQFAIVFSTPAYKDPRITSDVKVYVELFRPSDGRTSERLEFTYKAEEVFIQSKKRKANSYNSIGSSSGGSLSLTDLPEPLMAVNQVNSKEHLLNDISNALPKPPEMLTITNPMNGDGLSQALYEKNISEPKGAIFNYVSDFTSVPSSAIENHDAHIGSDLDKLLEANGVGFGPDVNDTLAEYFRSFDSEEFELNTMQYLHKSINLKADSGRGKGNDKKTLNLKSPTQDEEKPNLIKLTKDNTVSEDAYDAYYTPRDGFEVKKLVKELCDMIRNNTKFKKQVIREKLERLFELRLSNGDTFLHMTLCNNILPSMEYIVKIISSLRMIHLLNETNNRKQTILHLAIVNGLPHVIPFLISKGCSPMIEDFEGNNAFHYAVKFQACLKPLLTSVQKYNVEYNLNACNQERQTALHLAAIYQSSLCADLLLANGASYSIHDNEGRTPLHLAAYFVSFKVIETMVKYIPDCEIDATDGQGRTTLQIICGINSDTKPTSDMLQTVDLLLKKKANPLRASGHSDWNQKQEFRQLISQYLPSGDTLEDEIKSEPEDDFESADEGESEVGLDAMSAYIHELASALDGSGAWRELAARLKYDSLLNWFENTPSPTRTLLTQVKECQEDLTSEALAKILRDMGEFEAASIILRYINV